MTTKTTMALAELSEKGADATLLRDMIQFVAQRMMELDTESLCAAAYGERSAERANSRNGYRERLWETRAGSVDLKIPKLRKGSYFPGLLVPRRTAEKAMAAVIQEAYIQGVFSTARSMSWSKRWACRASPRARCRACVAKSMSACRPFSIARSRATGRTFGSMPRTSKWGSTPILRTLSLRPILGQRSVHVQAQTL